MRILQLHRGIIESHKDLEIKIVLISRLIKCLKQGGTLEHIKFYFFVDLTIYR